MKLFKITTKKNAYQFFVTAKDFGEAEKKSLELNLANPKVIELVQSEIK